VVDLWVLRQQQADNHVDDDENGLDADDAVQVHTFE
jgi:hypothetical protein